MTACTASFSITVPAPATSPSRASSDGRCAEPTNGIAATARDIEAIRDARLVTRLAARISASLDEIAPYASIEAAEEALVARGAAGRRVGLALGEGSTLGARARRVARSSREWPLAASVARGCRATGTLDALIALANDVDTLFLEAPIAASAADARANGSCDRWSSPLAPRELLELRARAPRTLLVLDLRCEDFARTPLTQAAMLVPGTLILRGFGDLWDSLGATTLAPTAFVAGPAPLVAALEPDARVAAIADRLIAELDAPELERRVQLAARAVRAA
jgi:hypothetical protein